MVVFLIATLLVGPSGSSATDCPGLSAPVIGEIVRDYAPVGRYGGHWGVDFSVAEGTDVHAAEAGTVTFAGEVAGVLSVTVDHGGGLRTSYSYLSEIDVVRGQRVTVGSVVGTSGSDHDLAAVHFSVRIGDVYQDPEDWLACFSSPYPALNLVPLPAT
jgi:murein DD-endopeptidase MepM/ murein hydrolase activator NlpD